MRQARAVVRLPDAHREGLRQLGARYFGETGRRLSRAALVRILVGRGLADIDQTRPLAEQLPLHALANKCSPASPRQQVREGPSLRKRILSELSASAEEVFTPARVSKLVGATSRDSVRNTLLVLAGRGLIDKLGPGQYRARREGSGADSAVACGAAGGSA